MMMELLSESDDDVPILRRSEERKTKTQKSASKSTVDCEHQQQAKKRKTDLIFQSLISDDDSLLLNTDQPGSFSPTIHRSRAEKATLTSPSYSLTLDKKTEGTASILCEDTFMSESDSINLETPSSKTSVRLSISFLNASTTTKANPADPKDSELLTELKKHKQATDLDNSLHSTASSPYMPAVACTIQKDSVFVQSPKTDSSSLQPLHKYECNNESAIILSDSDSHVSEKYDSPCFNKDTSSTPLPAHSVHSKINHEEVDSVIFSLSPSVKARSSDSATEIYLSSDTEMHSPMGSDKTQAYSDYDESFPPVDLGIIEDQDPPPSDSWNMPHVSLSPSTLNDTSLKLPENDITFNQPSTSKIIGITTGLGCAKHITGSDDELPSLSDINSSSHNVDPYDENENSYTQLKNIVADPVPSPSKPPAAPDEDYPTLTEKERLKLEREKVKQQKKLEKERMVVMRQAEREAKRAAKPGEVHRHMLIEVCINLKETLLGVHLEAECLAQGVPISFTINCVKNSIIYKRKLLDLTQTTSSQSQYTLESYLSIVMEMRDFVNLIHNQINNHVGGTTVGYKKYIEMLKQNRPELKITLLVLGVNKYFRNVKTRATRKLKDQVLQTNKCSRKNKEMTIISESSFNQALLDLQIEYDVNVITHEDEKLMSKEILRLNKSIAEAPTKRIQYDKQAQSVRTTGLKINKEGKGSLQVWARMLQEIKNVSADVSTAIVTHYRSPLCLLQAYRRCSSYTQAQLLLQDIEIRRGGGVVQTCRRVGKETSRRIHSVLTCTDPNFLIE